MALHLGLRELGELRRRRCAASRRDQVSGRADGAATVSSAGGKNDAAPARTAHLHDQRLVPDGGVVVRAASDSGSSTHRLFDGGGQPLEVAARWISVTQ